MAGMIARRGTVVGLGLAAVAAVAAVVVWLVVEWDTLVVIPRAFRELRDAQREHDRHVARVNAAKAAEEDDLDVDFDELREQGEAIRSRLDAAAMELIRLQLPDFAGGE